MLIFGGHIFGGTDDVAISQTEMSSNAPQHQVEFEAERLEYERLQARRAAVWKQLEDLRNATEPDLTGLFASTIQSKKTKAIVEVPKRPRIRPLRARESDKPKKRMLNQLPILTTTAELPFEAGTRSLSAIAPMEGVESRSLTRALMPVFMMPSVPSEATFLRRIPRQDTFEEEEARRREAEEYFAMKVIARC
jgi:hypothetical protein